MGVLDWLLGRRRDPPYDASWIAAEIDAHAPGDDPWALHRLLTACVTLSRGDCGGRLFGRELVSYQVAAIADRAQLYERALAVLRAWIASAGDSELAEIAEVVGYARLPVDISERERAGVSRDLDAAPREPRLLELERALEDDVDDAGAAMVLADWLQQHGDPRGELIALQLASERDPTRGEAAARHLDRHRAQLLGPLASVAVTGEAGEAAFTWRRGYIHRARLAYSTDIEITNARVLDRLLRHPSGRFLAELVLGLDVIADGTGNLGGVIEVLAARTAPALRVLHVGDFEHPDECRISWYHVGDLSRLWRALPRLRHLIVQGDQIELGELAHPTLARLELRTGALPRATARAIAAAAIPQLRHLDVWFGDPEYGGDTRVDDVLPLLARDDLPLEHLGLRNATFTDALCEPLARSPLLPRLSTLDLSLGTLSDDGARMLARHAGAFRHVTRLDLSRNYLTDAGRRAVAQLCARVELDDQAAARGGARYPRVRA